MSLNKSPRLLIVEDDPDSRRLWGMIAENSGWNYAATGDGQQAVDMYRGALDTSTPFTFLLLDCALPALSGFEVAAKVREIDRDIPILMLTAYHDSFMQAHANRTAVTKLLFKPIAPPEVTATIKRLMLESEAVPTGEELTKPAL